MGLHRRSKSSLVLFWGLSLAAFSCLVSSFEISSLSLSVEEIVSLMIDGLLEKNSSIDANHAHTVSIELR